MTCFEFSIPDLVRFPRERHPRCGLSIRSRLSIAISTGRSRPSRSRRWGLESDVPALPQLGPGESQQKAEIQNGFRDGSECRSAAAPRAVAQ